MGEGPEVRECSVRRGEVACKGKVFPKEADLKEVTELAVDPRPGRLNLAGAH